MHPCATQVWLGHVGFFYSGINVYDNSNKNLECVFSYVFSKARRVFIGCNNPITYLILPICNIEDPSKAFYTFISWKFVNPRKQSTECPPICWQHRTQLKVNFFYVLRILFDNQFLKYFQFNLKFQGAIWKIFSQGFRNRPYFLKYMVLRIGKLSPNLPTYWWDTLYKKETDIKK